MLIGLCGGICSGKHSVAEFLVAEHGFRQLYIAHDTKLGRAFNSKIAVGSSLCSTNRGSSPAQVFSDVGQLLDFVTIRWAEQWVTTDIWNEEMLDVLLRRPFFILVSVDAPISTRWRRYKERCAVLAQPAPSLEDFVLRNDDHLYSQEHGLAQLIDRAQIRLINCAASLALLHSSLKELDLPNRRRLRPDWDQYFMQLASLAAQRSNCMKRRVGCVLVRENRVISTGYNGTPRNLRNCNEGGCARCNGGQGSGVGLSACLCIHAEENALLEAGRERIRAESTLYCDTCPCLTCSIKITQVGISEVVYSQSYSMDNEKTADVFKEGGVRLRQFYPPRRGLVDLALSSSTHSIDQRILD